MILWHELPLKGNFLHAKPGVAMLTAQRTKNRGERRVIRVIRPVSRPNRPPTALPLVRNAVVVATIVVKMLACIVVNM